ncbi:unnamed protein product [Boreogadus saida]
MKDEASGGGLLYGCFPFPIVNHYNLLSVSRPERHRLLSSVTSASAFPPAPPPSHGHTSGGRLTLRRKMSNYRETCKEKRGGTEAQGAQQSPRGGGGPGSTAAVGSAIKGQVIAASSQEAIGQWMEDEGERHSFDNWRESTRQGQRQAATEKPFAGDLKREAASADQFEKKKTAGLPAVLRSVGGSLLRGDCGDARTANNGVVVERQLGPPTKGVGTATDSWFWEAVDEEPGGSL